MYTIVLANTRREAFAWAREEGISLRKIKFAQNSQTISGTYYDRVIELPSYGKRRDKHAINATIKRLLRKKPDLELVKLEDWVTPQIARPIPPDELRTAALLGDVGTPFSNGGFVPPGLTSAITVNSPLVPSGQAPVADRKEMDLRFQVTDESLQRALDQSAAGDVAPIDLNAERGGHDCVADENLGCEACIAEGRPEIPADTPLTVEPLTPAQAEAAQEVVAEISESLEEIDNGLTEAGPEPERPKKRGRRTNEQKAYDEAKAIFDLEQTEQNARALSAAYDDLVKRHPDDERIVAEKQRTESMVTKLPKLPKLPKLNVPGVAQGAPDLDF
jgi:hypothetical protein